MRHIKDRHKTLYGDLRSDLTTTIERVPAADRIGAFKWRYVVRDSSGQVVDVVEMQSRTKLLRLLRFKNYPLPKRASRRRRKR